MSGKGRVNADEGPKVKGKWNMIPVLEELEVLGTLDMGMRAAEVRHHSGVNKSTICVIKKTDDEDRVSTKATGHEQGKHQGHWARTGEALRPMGANRGSTKATGCEQGKH